MKLVVTAGPTREPIDPVRFLSNRSSGRMGYALAAAAGARGHQVVLVSGPTCLEPPAGARFIAVETALDMRDAVHGSLAGADAVIMCAAVADYRPASYSPGKLKKSDAVLAAIPLVENPDILADLGHARRDYLLVGFAAESGDLEANARAKLQTKQCDLIVANSVGGEDSVLDSETTEVRVFFRDGRAQRIGRADKRAVAARLIQIVERL